MQLKSPNLRSLTRRAPVALAERCENGVCARPVPLVPGMLGAGFVRLPRSRRPFISPLRAGGGEGTEQVSSQAGSDKVRGDEPRWHVEVSCMNWPGKDWTLLFLTYESCLPEQSQIG